MTDIRQIVSDTEFIDLPNAEKIKVLKHLDPDYAALPEQEQVGVLDKLISSTPMPISNDIADQDIQYLNERFQQDITRTREQSQAGYEPLTPLFYTKKKLEWTPDNKLRPTRGEPVYKRDLIRGGITTAGDIIGTMVAPELKIASKTPALARWGARGVNLVSRMLGSGAGSGAGSVISDIVNRDKIDREAAAGEAIVGATAEGIMSPLAYVGKKLLAPFASKMTPEQKIVAEAVEGKNLPISPTAYSPTKMAGVPQVIADWFPTGRLWGQHKRNQLGKNIMAEYDNILESLPARTSRIEAGVLLAEGVKSTKTKMTQEYKDLYKYAKDIAGAKGIPLTNTVEYIKSIRNQIRDPKLSAQIERILRGTKERQSGAVKYKAGTAQYRDINAWLSEIWKGGKSDPIRGKIKESIIRDIAAWDGKIGRDIVKYRALADRAYKKRLQFISNPTVKAILKANNYAPDKVILNAFNEGNIATVKTLEKHLDKETWDYARSRFVENILEASIEKNGLDYRFNPAVFSKIFSKYEKQIKNAMPELYDSLKRFEIISRASIQDYKKQEIGSQLAGNIAAPLMIGGKAVFGGVDPVTIAVPSTFSFMMSKSLMNPKGLMRKWLTSGLNLPESVKKTVPGVLKYFTHQGYEWTNDKEDEEE